jgi:tRNA threonylcarbamoyladenosine biosynthesis protein TsaE
VICKKEFELTFDQINQLSKIISKNLEIGDVILLNGDLGTGKTFFTQKICYFLNPEIQVFSPTFGLYNIYDFGNFSIWHYDLYRLKAEQMSDELMNLDLDEAISNNVVMIEWAERLNVEFGNSLSIKFFFLEGERRIIELKYGEKSKWSNFLSNFC